MTLKYEVIYLSQVQYLRGMNLRTKDEWKHRNITYPFGKNKKSLSKLYNLQGEKYIFFSGYKNKLRQRKTPSVIAIYSSNFYPHH